MEILGLNPIYVVIGATALGVVLRVVLGWAKSGSSFNPKKTISTLISGFFSGIVLVSGIIFEIPATADQQTVLVLIVGSVSAVMGADAAVRTAGKIAQDKIKV